MPQPAPSRIRDPRDPAVTPALRLCAGLLCAALAACQEDPLPRVDGGADGPVDVPDATGMDAAAEAPPATDTAAALMPPAQCRVSTTSTPPFQVTFKVTNRMGVPVFLVQDCVGIEFDVASCAAGYTDDVGPKYVCACNCADASCTGNVACGPCQPRDGVALPPGASRTMVWQAQHVVTRERTSYSCAERTPLPAAKYRLRVPIYLSREAAAANQPAPRWVGREFDLPAPGEVETFVIEPDTDAGVRDGGVSDGGVSDGGASDVPQSCEFPGPWVTCAPPFSPEVACTLDRSYSFGSIGGLRPFYEEAKLERAGRFTLTRHSPGGGTPPVACNNQLPRCGARPGLITTAEVMKALAAPDVMAAFAPTPQVFGHDARPYDGTAFSVTRDDGHGVIIGVRCDATHTCARPLPEALAQLGTLLNQVVEQQRAAGGCEALR